MRGGRRAYTPSVGTISLRARHQDLAIRAHGAGEVEIKAVGRSSFEVSDCDNTAVMAEQGERK